MDRLSVAAGEEKQRLWEIPAPVALDILEKATRSEIDYRQSIRSAVRGLWQGSMPMIGFLQTMNGAVNRGFTRAFYDGARQVGIAPDELTTEERAALAAEIFGEISHIYGFGDAILNAKRGGGKLSTMFRRADLWANRFAGVRSWAMSLVGRDRKLTWVMNPIKEHCTSCLKLNGRVYRASIWQKHNIYPRHRALACEGYRCGCEFRPTDAPVTRGRPPSIP